MRTTRKPLYDPATNPFIADDWTENTEFTFQDITYHTAKVGGTVRIAFNRPECRNAFRPQTVDELYHALLHAAEDPDIGVVLLTGNGPSPKDGGWAFCSGGDQRVRGKDGYTYTDTDDKTGQGMGRLHP